MLTPEQQAIAEEAVRLIRPVYVAFHRRMPCLRAMMKVCDLEGAAQLAVCKAAKTYDPERGVGVSAYFSVAIKNAFLREIEREMKSMAHSIRRIPIEEVDMRATPKMPVNEAAMPALLKLTDEDRAWIESYVFDGGSFKSLARDHDIDHRFAKRLIKARLGRLRNAVEDEPHS